MADEHSSAGSFEQLAMPLFARLYNFARWLTRDRTEAEDLVQETYTKALKGFASFQQGTGSASFAQAGIIQAIAHGEVDARPKLARYSVVLTRPGAGGVNAIAEMQFEGKRSVLVLAPAEKAALVRDQMGLHRR